MTMYLNKTLIKGRIGQNPALRYLPSGDPVCNFSVATKSGNHVEWHKIVCYKALAEFTAGSFKGGDLVFLEAEIRTREFQTAEDKAAGRKARKVVELIASEVHLVTKRGGEDSDPIDTGEPENTPGHIEDDSPGNGGSMPRFI